MEPTESFIEIDGVDICFFEWGERGAPQLLLVHATGFHSRCWDQIVKKLPDGLNVFCVDMRGHGRSEKTGPYSWDRFGTDLLRFCEAVNLCDAVGVGHSMGGYCVTHVAAQNNSHFKQLLLVDPVIMEPSVYKNSERHKFDSVGDHPVARRKAVFKDAQEMYLRYKDRMPYNLWQDAVFKDYCDFGVLPATAGGVNLACPPHVEASIYMANFESNLHDLIPTISTPTVILRAAPRDAKSEEVNFASSPTWPDLAKQFINGHDVFLPELSHFIPMQDPELTLDFILGALES